MMCSPDVSHDILFSSFLVLQANIMMFSSEKKKALLALMAIIVIGTGTVLFTDYGFPYSTDDSKPAYQRLILQVSSFSSF